MDTSPAALKAWALKESALSERALAKKRDFCAANDLTYEPGAYEEEIALFRAVAALADLADGGGWRAMDIAPRDGTRVLTYSPGAVALGFRAIRVNWFEDGLWQHTNAQHWPPTHWRPLPAPPKENDDGR